MVQVELSDRENHRMVVWIDQRWLKELKEKELTKFAEIWVRGKDGKDWLIEKIYETTVDSSALHKDWSVGGL